MIATDYVVLELIQIVKQSTAIWEDYLGLELMVMVYYRKSHKQIYCPKTRENQFRISHGYYWFWNKFSKDKNSHQIPELENVKHLQVSPCLSSL